jgi:hypothetical protein
MGDEDGRSASDRELNVPGQLVIGVRPSDLHRFFHRVPSFKLYSLVLVMMLQTINQFDAKMS